MNIGPWCTSSGFSILKQEKSVNELLQSSESDVCVARLDLSCISNNMEKEVHVLNKLEEPPWQPEFTHKPPKRSPQVFVWLGGRAMKHQPRGSFRDEKFGDSILNLTLLLYVPLNQPNLPLQSNSRVGLVLIIMLTLNLVVPR